MDMINRTPPQAINSEEVVLGSALMNQEAAEIASESIKPIEFYRPAHQILFEVIRKINRSADRVDLITVSNELKNINKLEEIGGINYIVELSNIVPVVVGLHTHIKSIKHTHGLREVITTSQSLVDQCYSNEIESSEKATTELEKIVFDLSSKTTRPTGFTHISDIVHKCFKTIEGLSNGSITSTGLSTGYTDLDRMTLGLQPSDLIVLAARPSMGKTALAMNIVENVTKQGGQVGVVSLEMDKTSLVMRLLSSVAQIDSYILKSGKMKQSDWPKLNDAAGQLSEMGIFVDDSAGLSPYEIRSRARRLASKHNISLIVVDYIQLSDASARSEQEEISIISRNMKAMAKELNVPVLALSQLNRSCESRTDKKPMLSDLRGSGSIEQDADVIAFVYRDEMYNKSDDNPMKGIAEIIFGKQRNGHTGTVKLNFKGAFTRFDNLITMHEPAR